MMQTVLREATVVEGQAKWSITMNAAYPFTIDQTSTGRGFSDTTTLVVSLLRHGLSRIDVDIPGARSSLSRACALLEAEAAGPAGVASVAGGLAGWQKKRVTEYIDKNIEEPVGLTDLASVARLSGNHFARAFKRSFGMTPHNYVFRRRLEAARDLMLTTDLPLSEIALACGFADQAHFTRRFRAEVGSPPNAWRREVSIPPEAPATGWHRSPEDQRNGFVF